MHIGTRQLSRAATIVATAAVVVAATSGIAIAAMLIFGTGLFSADPAGTMRLTVDRTQLTGALYPGATVGARAVVHNPNGFPVRVTDVVVEDNSLTGVPIDCTGLLSLIGGEHGNWPDGTGDTAPGWRFSLSHPVTIAAASAQWVEVPDSVHQADSGHEICGVSGHVVIIATVG